ncbi:hypothetical protein DRE_06702 [Drechslerella stenobrocha 248]|uniref:Uncharacterized protein n=1 Tax=Drechslerella stenobrocha 248 TaxID=1043628 RepID=W7I6R9_9PEZI|nr:hypothetical protein DRE_06702 [Drechslerella stenobrocha 248]
MSTSLRVPVHQQPSHGHSSSYSRPGALSFKVPDANRQEIRPPLTPATEVDLQKSCAILVQSTSYSRSFRDAANSTYARHKGALPARSGPPSARRKTPSKSGNRTPVGRVSKAHRRAASNVRFEKTATSQYVPPRRPAPAKALPATKKPRNERKSRLENHNEAQDSESPTEAKVDRPLSPKQRPLDTKKPLEAKPTDTSSGEETEKNRKGVKKLVVNMHHAVTGYIRPIDLVSSPLSAESQSSPIRHDRLSSESPDKPKPANGDLKVRSSRRKDGTTYVEALPEYLHSSKSSSEEDRKPGEAKPSSVSKRLGHAMKEYVKPPYVDRFTPEPLSTATSSNHPRRATDSKKHSGVTKVVKEYVKPSLPLDIASAIAMDVDPLPAKSEKSPKAAKKDKSPVERAAPSIPAELPAQKPKSTGTAGHHNPFRKIQDYVKPAAQQQPVTLSSPPARKPSTAESSQPSKPYVPPKIRLRGDSLPSSISPLATSNTTGAPNRPGPIFGGGYPVKQEVSVANKDKENRGPVSPGFFGRNPTGSGFRIHFSHLLHKQRGDGYDQLE